MHAYAVRPKDSQVPLPSRARTAASPRPPIERLHRFVGNQALQRQCDAATISSRGRVIQLQTEAWPRNATQGRDMEQAMARLTGPPGRRGELEDRGEGVVSIEAGTPFLAPITEEKEEKARPVQAKAAHGDVGARPAVNPDAIVRGMPNGSPVDGPLRNSMEGFFGTDFGDVQFHTGPRVQALAGSLGAQAFTIGNHVAFADGRYQPHTTEGQRLIAHELTHVVQQRQGISGVLLADGIGRPGDGQGQRGCPTPGRGRGCGDPVVQRQRGGQLRTHLGTDHELDLRSIRQRLHELCFPVDGCRRLDALDRQRLLRRPNQ
jgi:hypothetical protein